MSNPPHQPVLKQQVLDALRLKNGYFVIDCTVGAGGHATEIVQAIAPTGQLLGLDADPTALNIAQTRLSAAQGSVRLMNTNFEHLRRAVSETGFPPAQAILADLGVSSMQLDRPERGFSFMADGPLDMRMGPDAGQSAEEMVNTLPEKDLANIIFRYGEERRSRAIARAIVNARPITSTLALANVVSKVVGRRGKQKIHPATRTFQAIRIAVNDELGALERFLPQAIDLLAPGGRLAIISFHSLEDRIVKRYFKQEATDCLCPPKQPVCTCGHRATVALVTRKPIVAGPDEIEDNPRARSAKLRVVERLRNM